MKNIIIAIMCLYQVPAVFSQSIGISATGTTPHASAMLDISSSNKGFLMPRMNTVQRNAIASPAEGLKLYDTDTKSFWYYNGNAWVQLVNGSPVNFWTSSNGNIYNNNTGNVGIGLNTPLAPLHIRNNDEALQIQGSTPYISFNDSTGTRKGFLQSYNDDLYLGTPSGNTLGNVQFYTANNPAFTIKYNGMVGIGTTNPRNRLQIGDGGLSFYDLAINNFGHTFGISQGTNQTRFESTADIALSPRLGEGNIGINTAISPVNKLQIGSMGATSFATNDFAIGNGSNAMAILQTNSSTLWGSTTDMVLRPRNNGAGNVGINVLAPANKLQIGSVGNSGFATNDFAIGNGTDAMAIYQTSSSTLVGSTTDIVLKPQNNGRGRVGINTNTPRAPLDIAYSASVVKPGAFYNYSYLNVSSGDAGVGFGSDNPVPLVSVVADGRVLANEFDAFSDARIKNIVDVSNSAADLKTVNALQITNYVMKDNVRYRGQLFKKIIAQQVEKVYPQVVSRHTDFIPNVYQPAVVAGKTAEGYRLKFAQAHQLGTQSKKIQLMLPESGTQTFFVVSIPSAFELIVAGNDIGTDKVFVYGEEVDDFRTVDYEGLTTLNISATQELSKLIKQQQAIINSLQRKVSWLSAGRGHGRVKYPLR